MFLTGQKVRCKKEINAIYNGKVLVKIEPNIDLTVLNVGFHQGEVSVIFEETCIDVDENHTLKPVYTLCDSFYPVKNLSNSDIINHFKK